MIRVIFAEKGEGKTKRILDMTNEALETAKGSIVFIDNNKQYMFDIKRDIRFVDASEFAIDGPKMFYGFLCGIAAQDFDLEYIFIDSFLQMIHHPVHTLEGLFENLDKWSDRRGVKIIISANGNPQDVPEFIKPYVV